MISVLALLARFAAIVLGYALACLAASAFLNLLFFGSQGLGGEERRIALATSLVSIPVLALAIAHLAFVPASVAIAAAELLAWRDWLTHALAGGAIGLVVEFFGPGSGPASDPGGVAAIAAAGMLAGIVYGLAAGRGAGGRQARPPPAAPER
jgi:hypothetical protein